MVYIWMSPQSLLQGFLEGNWIISILQLGWSWEVEPAQKNQVTEGGTLKRVFSSLTPSHCLCFLAATT